MMNVDEIVVRSISVGPHAMNAGDRDDAIGLRLRIAGKPKT